MIRNLLENPLTQQQLRELSVLALAHVGDGVYELLVRGHVVSGGHAQKAAQMHKQTVGWVSAGAQATFARTMEQEGFLTEEEVQVLLRGRNAKPKTIPKHAGLEAYAYATGLECLFGYLYLLGRNERIDQLWQAVVAEIDPVQV